MALLLLGGTALPVLAREGDVIRRGACSGPDDWKRKLSEDNSRIEVEYEVDQSRVGDVWRVRIRHDGDLVFAARRTTKAASGSFTVRLEQRTDPATTPSEDVRVNLRTEEICCGRGCGPPDASRGPKPRWPLPSTG